MDGATPPQNPPPASTENTGRPTEGCSPPTRQKVETISGATPGAETFAPSCALERELGRATGLADRLDAEGPVVAPDRGVIAARNAERP